MSFNQTAFLWIHKFAGRSAVLDGLDIFFAKWLPYLLVLGFLLLLLTQREWRKRFYWFAEGAMAVILARGIVTEVIRHFYHHERPFSFYNFVPLVTESGWSFPSGHAAWFFALAMVVWYMNRKWGIWFFVLAAINAVARVYAGVHWPLDVIGGAILGIFSAMLIHALLKSAREGLSRKAVSPVL